MCSSDKNMAFWRHYETKKALYQDKLEAYSISFLSSASASISFAIHFAYTHRVPVMMQYIYLSVYNVLCMSPKAVLLYM